MLPKFLIIEEYVVDKTFTMNQVVNKIYVDYPQYDIIGPVTIKNPKGAFKVCYFSLKLNFLKNTSSEYGI
jgi:hypothetical protein